MKIGENMLIRLMQIQDYPQVYELWLSCAGMGLNDLDDSRDGIEKYLRRNPETCFVAQEGEKIVGVILSGHDGRRGYIHHTAVHPAFRGRGLGSSLVETAMTALERCGIHKVALVVFSKNVSGNNFWERRGFTVREDLVYRNKALCELVRIDT